MENLEQDLLNFFDITGSVKNPAPRFLIDIKVARQYLNEGLSITCDNNGYFYLNGQLLMKDPINRTQLERDGININDVISGIAKSILYPDQLLLISNNGLKKINVEDLHSFLMKGCEVTVGEDGYFYVGGMKQNKKANECPVIQHTTDTMVTIEPNKLHVWGEVKSLTIGFADGTLGRVSEYRLQFSCPANSATALTLPTGVKWANGNTLQTEPGCTYQVSIMGNLAAYARFK